MSAHLWLNFYGEIVLLSSEWIEVVNLIEKDFSMFKSAACEKNHLSIEVFKTHPSNVKIPQVSSRMQSLNSITYQVRNIRYNDYYGNLLSIFDYNDESAKIYSEQIEKTHEVLYLLILSRIGKKLDIRGLHKLHAFAVSYGDIALVCMMPMRGGKSTLLLEMLKYPDIKMISDDIPLVTRQGEVLPFPIKIGVNHFSGEIEVNEPEKNVYKLLREHYGEKTFISLNGLPERIEKIDKKFKKVILIEALRFNSDESQLRPESGLRVFVGLFKHGVIGIGLPMIIEYFWEFGIKDFFIKTYIFISRFLSFSVLAIKATNYRLSLGRKPQNAALLLYEKLKSA